MALRPLNRILLVSVQVDPKPFVNRPPTHLTIANRKKVGKRLG